MVLTGIAFGTYAVATAVQAIAFFKADGNIWRRVSHAMTFAVCFYFAVIYLLVLLGVLESQLVGEQYLRYAAIVIGASITNQTLCYWHILTRLNAMADG